MIGKVAPRRKSITRADEFRNRLGKFQNALPYAMNESNFPLSALPEPQDFIAGHARARFGH